MSDECLILGAGLVGSLSALRLDDAGLRCTLVDTGGVLRGASLNNAGGLYFQAQPQTSGFDALQLSRLQRLASLVAVAAEAWRRLEARMPLDGALVRSGGAIVADDDAGVAALRHKWAQENAWGLRSEWLDAAQLRALAPTCAPDVRAATYCAEEGHCDPIALAERVQDALARTDVRQVFGRSIVDAARDGAGYRVALDDGTQLRASRLLVCLGPFGDRVLRKLGLASGLQALPLQIHLLQAPPGSVPLFLRYVGQRLSLKQFRNGDIVVGGGWPADPHPQRPMDVRFRDDSTRENLALARRIIPCLAQATLRERRGGWAAWTDDGLPNIGGFSDAPGVFAAYGGNGYTLAPIYAESLADLVLERAPALDLSAFSPDRHRDLEQGASLPPDG